MAFDDLQFPIAIPDPAQPAAQKKSFVDVVGGSATYAALSASSYAPVRIVAVVGTDFPEEMLARLQARGVDTEGIDRIDGKTFRWVGRYHDDLVGRDSLDTQLNVFADFRPRLPASYKDSALVLLGNIHPSLQLEVLDQVSAPELVVADTMNFWISGERDTLAKVLERIDVLVINDEEARLLTGLHNVAQAADQILTLGPSKLIIKRGEHGCLYFDSEGVFAAPALPLRQVHDPTGAGDSFAGGLMGYLARGGKYDHNHFRQAIIHATATASCCVEALGTTGLAELASDGIDARVQRVRALIDISLSS